jgi:glycosyltransferase involved in cell wall biosynthesis
MRAAVPRTRRPIAVIPFGVDGNRFRPAWDRRTGGVALGVGTVSPFKRWELAAEALRGTGLRFHLVGPTPDRAYAERVRSAGDQVELLGELTDEELVRRFAESDLLVHPSRVELLSGVVVQGMSAGLPILGGPALDGVVEDGRVGYCVADPDSRTFTAGLRQRATELAGNAALRRQMGEAARATAQDRYAWPRVVQRYLEVYRTVVTSSEIPRAR